MRPQVAGDWGGTSGDVRAYQPKAPTAEVMVVTLGRSPAARQTALRSSRHLPSLRAGAIWWKVEQFKQRRARRWKSFRWVPALPPSCAA